MKRFSYILIAALIGFTSCHSSKKLTAHVEPLEIDEVYIIEPFGYISLIQQSNKAFEDELLSAKSAQITLQALQNPDLKIPIGGIISVQDADVRHLLAEETDELISAVIASGKISHLKIPPTISKVLKANEARYGLLTVQAGFSRSSKNYRGEIAKSIFMGFITLGLFQSTPIKANSNVYIMIVDAESDRVVFARYSKSQNEPLHPSALEVQLHHIFKGYFF